MIVLKSDVKLLDQSPEELLDPATASPSRLSIEIEALSDDGEKVHTYTGEFQAFSLTSRPSEKADLELAADMGDVWDKHAP